MRAWETVCMGIASVVLATSRAKARYATWHAAREAGYKVAFGDIRVRRSPSHDDLVPVCVGVLGTTARPRVLSEDYVFRLRGGVP